MNDESEPKIENRDNIVSATLLFVCVCGKVFVCMEHFISIATILVIRCRFYSIKLKPLSNLFIGNCQSYDYNMTMPTIFPIAITQHRVEE